MLVEIWDYFMRRKPLLLLLLAIFGLSSFGMSQILQSLSTPAVSKSNTETSDYIRVADWDLVNDPIVDNSDAEIEVPHTGEIVDEASPIITVMSPAEVVELNPEPVRIPNTSTPEDTEVTFGRICYNIVLAVLGTGIIALGIYLTYQHFMR